MLTDDGTRHDCRINHTCRPTDASAPCDHPTLSLKGSNLNFLPPTIAYTRQLTLNIQMLFDPAEKRSMHKYVSHTECKGGNRALGLRWAPFPFCRPNIYSRARFNYSLRTNLLFLIGTCIYIHECTSRDLWTDSTTKVQPQRKRPL